MSLALSSMENFTLNAYLMPKNFTFYVSKLFQHESSKLSLASRHFVSISMLEKDSRESLFRALFTVSASRYLEPFFFTFLPNSHRRSLTKETKAQCRSRWKLSIGVSFTRKKDENIKEETFFIAVFSPKQFCNHLNST